MLTSEQMAAVETYEPLSTVQAGAGAGKTTLIIERVLELIDRGVNAERIIILTFSRMAAKELRDRLGDTGKKMHVGTFHSVLLEVMAKIGEHPNILDAEEAEAVAVECAIQLGLAVRKPDGVKYKKASAGALRKEIEARIPGALTSMYKSHLALRGDIDYVGIIHRGIELVEYFRGTHVIVDEAQDNDALQWKFVKLLSGVASVQVVGDVCQCIHSWRGAKPEELENLPWPAFPLTETFRCPEAVVALANRIQHISVTLRTSKPGGNIITSGDTLSLVKMALTQFAPEEVAILCRYNANAAKWAYLLNDEGLPVALREPVERGPIFWLLRYLSSPRSVTGRLKAAKELSPYLSLTDEHLWQCICSGRGNDHVASLVEHWLAKIGVSYGPKEILSAMNIPFGLAPEARRYSDEYAGETLAYWRREETAPLTDNAKECITISTIHGAKGLEWPCVIIPELVGRPSVEECRLFYVGTTRVMDTLIFPDGSNWQGYLKEG